MKISLEWLSQYLSAPVDAEAAARALTHGGFPVETIQTVGNDTVIDVEVTSNRGDCLSHLGVAREIAALLNGAVREIDTSLSESAAPPTASVRIDAEQLCPYYSARIVRGVRIGPSPEWLSRRLQAVGLRSINNVVDVTNYVMFELGQPLHAFDLDKLASPDIIVRRAQEGEKLTSIDGHERKLSVDMLVIADQRQPVALAGVMGGLETQVTDQTVNILLESARFDALNVRKTARQLALMSDSSYRFERGVAAQATLLGSARAAQLILQVAGGTLERGVVEAGSCPVVAGQLTLRLARLHGLLGVTFATAEIVGALERLQLQPRLEGDCVHVTIPWWRMDLRIEVDLIEEVARVIGYDQIPQREEISIHAAPLDQKAAALKAVHGVLMGCGYFESITFSFVSDRLAGDFVPPEAAALPQVAHAVRKADGRLRPSLLPGLLEALRHNETNGTPDARLYEIGSAFWTNQQGKVCEQRHLALVGGADIQQMRGVLEAILEKLNRHRKLAVTPDHRVGFAAGSCGRVQWGDQVLGWFGRLDKDVAGHADLKSAPVAAEVNLSMLLDGAEAVPQLQPLSRFPAIRRDLSLVVNETIRYQQIMDVLDAARLSMLEHVQYITTYRGKPLEKGQKSVTIQLVFRAPSSTLTSDEVETSVQQFIEAAKRDLGATLRL